MIQSKYFYQVLGKVKMYYLYEVVMDDFVVMVTYDDGKYSIGHYTKLYGDWRQLLSHGEDDAVYTVLDRDNSVFKACEIEATAELGSILWNIRARH